MSGPKAYITQITGEELKKIFAVANIEPGFLIRIDREGDKMTISVDENGLRAAINGFIRNGGGVVNASDARNIPFDPPS